MNHAIKIRLKDILYASPLKGYFIPKYDCGFSVPQFIFLCKCIEECRDIPGSIAEIGCNSGATTIFLNKYMEAQGIDKPYYAIDTFCGFPDEDIKCEVSQRGKERNKYSTAFKTVKKRHFDEAMRYNGVDVTSIEADVNEYDLKSLGPLSFCLLDVDLYRPTSKSLGEIIMSPGGILVVDDCVGRIGHFDGAEQAYREFMEAAGRPIEIAYKRLGVVRNPPIP